MGDGQTDNQSDDVWYFIKISKATIMHVCNASLTSYTCSPHQPKKISLINSSYFRKYCTAGKFDGP